MIEILKYRNEDKKKIYLKFKEYIKNTNISYSKEFNRIINEDITKLNEIDIKSSGYVIDTLESCIWCFLTTNNYKEAILKAINLGGDADTIGAITGSIAGLYYKENILKDKWCNSIINLEEILNIIEKYYNVLNKE